MSRAVSRTMKNEDLSLRRQSRELALQVLFQKEFNKEVVHLTSLKNFKSSFSFPSTVWDYAALLLEGVASHLEQIDKNINALSSNWSTTRMALVDLLILRIAVFEMTFSDEVPGKVAVNEAIEVSKKYGGSDSHQFINGILAQLLPVES